MRNIAIVAGGDSSEWVISVQSGEQVANEMKRIGYNAYVVQIKGQNWQVVLDDNTKAQIDKNDFSFSENGQKCTFDCAIMAIHGTPGEDGRLQAYFELIGLPHSTCGVLAAALTFNKYACKVFLQNFGVKSAKAILLNKNVSLTNCEVEDKLGMPCFVKPNESGSSFGISKINNPVELHGAINNALLEGEEVIIEEFISGTEVTCGMVKIAGNETIFPITEIVTKNEYFDYEAKYKGESEEITPARLSADVAENIRQTTSLIYNKLNCKGIVRVDYIISNNEPYFLELNSVPGMSPNSIVPQQLRVMGSSLANMYQLIIEDICKKIR